MSGDIDSVYIHLYVVSRYWKRTETGKFKTPLYVILQKKGPKYDVYNKKAMIELFEITYSDRNIGMKIAFSLCMGGNDFVTALMPAFINTFGSASSLSFFGTAFHLIQRWVFGVGFYPGSIIVYIWRNFFLFLFGHIMSIFYSFFVRHVST